ncbi:class I SAM-dependent methyltransferase [Sphingomonas canadensis]|uniref:Class I SAM-dependent methyltransferase n=1 Tax=Sphingomonas canadensis TaxID=1219257 RepID=A0ABW3H9Z8_9SPHN|nr:class I SAM-dependent methyltransferase [Sphingomonas canadensis]MCW3835411.1 class I SAM-dependent methyltransferase [Sphingomonas canadensis]
MSIETAYYENPDFWTDEALAGEHDRYATTASLIPGDAQSLIDVGCGNGAFVHYLMASGRPFGSIHAVDRSEAALRCVRAEKSQAPIDALPFADRSFDIATCLEVIEHLPFGVYERGLGELARVASRYVLISVPYEEDLEGTLIRCPSCTSRFNPDYHMRRYDDAMLASLLEPHGFAPVDKRMSGAMARYWLVPDWTEKRRRDAGKRGNPFHTPIPCPICGFTLPPEGSLPSARPAAQSPGTSGGLKGLAKRLLRRDTRYGAIAMLYQRRD